MTLNGYLVNFNILIVGLDRESSKIPPKEEFSAKTSVLASGSSFSQNPMFLDGICIYLGLGFQQDLADELRKRLRACGANLMTKVSTIFTLTTKVSYFYPTHMTVL